MKFKEIIENHPLIIIAGVFSLGAGTAWLACQELYVKPRDYTIEQLKMGTSTKVENLSNKIESDPLKNENHQITSKENHETKTYAPLTIRYYSLSLSNKEENLLANIRTNKNLRQLQPLESSKRISDLPSGTFFFVPWVYLGGEINDFSKVSNIYRFDDVSQTSFEIHILEDRSLELIGYIPNTIVSGISYLDGNSVKDVSLSSKPWDQSNTLVIIPMERIVSSITRTIETDNRQTIAIIDAKIK